ncbi:hypothetical protein HELRODRAFT_194472, partial [Helobdella robusta]|uniref:Rho-GAP domain-containing protein n=1 Tax=Helobdella robusta TaxID=6412 RepID=T1FW34_HELRO
MTNNNENKKFKKDKEIALELENQIKDVKHQLSEQLKCLDGRLESHTAMLNELGEFYQRRAEAELEYSKSLDKIVRQIVARHKAEKQKRENWQNFSTYKLWQAMLRCTTRQSQHHASFSDSLNNVVAIKFQQLKDDMARIYKKCHEIAGSLHAELHKSMTELHSIYHNESQQLDLKLSRVETHRTRFEQTNKKGSSSKKLITFDKKTEKQRIKTQEGNLKAHKARNEYLLSIDSTNAALRKYFIDDLPDIINAMDYSYHISLGHSTIICVELEATMDKLNAENLVLISSKITEIQSNNQLRDEMVSRVQTITDRLHSLKLENDELWKTLETTDNSMVAKLTTQEVDVADVFASPGTKLTFTKNNPDYEKQMKEWLETQEFYFNKFKNYELNSNLVARLHAKCLALEKVLAITKDDNQKYIGVNIKRLSSGHNNRPIRKKALGKYALESKPKLFGGSVREYVNATGEEIPLVIRSCTKIINLYGMHHQGVFRIPGLQHEINEYKKMFEKGEEPILTKVETRDINSVAGVLKLYFRELSEPLFPLQIFDELVACSKYNIEDADEKKKCIERIQELLLPLPRTNLSVIRYLFAFLNHSLSEYSDENMMDAHNLAVCFGPTLLPVPPDHDPVNHQNQINDLIEILIVYHELIFPKDHSSSSGGVVYEKFIVDVTLRSRWTP